MFPVGQNFNDAALALTDIAPEVNLNFINRLDRSALINLQCTCRTFNSCILENDWLWRNLFAAEQGGYLPKEPPTSWRSFYIEQHVVRRNIARGVAAEPIAATLTGCLHYGTFTYKNRYYVSQGFKLACYDLTTGAQIYTWTHIPKEAFVTAADEDVGLFVTRIHPIDSRHFLLEGKVLAVWDAEANSSIFAAESPHFGPPYIDESRIIFAAENNLLQVWNYRTKKLLTTIPDVNEDAHKMLYAIGDNVFSLSWHCELDGYDSKQQKPLFSNINYKPHTDLTNSAIFKAKNHLVIVSTHIGSPSLFVAAIVSLQKKIPCSVVQLSKPEHLHAGFDSAKEIALVHGEHLVGIDPDNTQSISCWNLDTLQVEKRFPTPAPVYTFHIAEPNRLITTCVDVRAGLYRILIWDMNNPEQPIGDIPSTSYDCRVHNNLLCVREVTQFRFFNLINAQEIGTVPFTQFVQKPIHEDLLNLTEWTFDGSRIHIQQKEGVYYYWIINLNL